ncbi:hypothetical protein [Yersinia intermedia]|uniref:hypothetical protein n=1 Tax=Yersinia intermedia TaxID=631 RepID=UPI000B417193|nr:hypothetical protein [Yersinia intermedia]OVZ75203.1 hypothetical protein CBW55_10715 [Yersinia intermedia]
MAKIPFTDRELTRAWRNSIAVSKATPRLNPHRLLLFYAIECGLKAAYLKSIHKNIIDSSIADEFSHDINKICTKLVLGSQYQLPYSLKMKDCIINNKQHSRTCSSSELNQIWRYGGELNGAIDDNQIESKLEKLNDWIEKALQ